jgi:hypothetical protein
MPSMAMEQLATYDFSMVVYGKGPARNSWGPPSYKSAEPFSVTLRIASFDTNLIVAVI